MSTKPSENSESDRQGHSPLTEKLGLVERLRHEACNTSYKHDKPWDLLMDAADEIERLRMDLENTRAEALLAVAAERERCANFSEGAVLDEMRRLDPNWNGYGQSRSAALATAFKALRRVIAGPNVQGNAGPTA